MGLVFPYPSWFLAGRALRVTFAELGGARKGGARLGDCPYRCCPLLGGRWPGPREVSVDLSQSFQQEIVTHRSKCCRGSAGLILCPKGRRWFHPPFGRQPPFGRSPISASCSRLRGVGSRLLISFASLGERWKGLLITYGCWPTTMSKRTVHAERDSVFTSFHLNPPQDSLVWRRFPQTVL